MQDQSLTVGLCRASDEKQETSCDVQEAEIRKACDAFNLGTPLMLVEPPNCSGGTPFAKRSMGSWVLRHLGKGSVLVVTKIDRLARDVRDLLNTIETLNKRGVRIIILQFGSSTLDMDSAIGRLIVVVLGAVAEFERHLIRTRTKEALAYRKKMGLLPAPKRFCHFRVVHDRDGKIKPSSEYNRHAGDVRRVELDVTKFQQILEIAAMVAGNNEWQVAYEHCEKQQFADAAGKLWWRRSNEEACLRRPVLRFKTIQQAVLWLHRTKAVNGLPEPYQAVAESITPPKGFKLAPVKRTRKPKCEVADRSQWSREQWAAWFEETQQA